MYVGKHRARRKRRQWLRFSALGATGLLAAVLLAQTVSAKTYVITDGDRVITYTTFATSPTEVLDQAGLELGEYDSFVTEDGAITVSRAPSITIYYHGQSTKATTSGETVGELLTRLGMEVTGEDVLSHGMEDRLYDGMELRIDQFHAVQEQYCISLPHETTYCSDPTLPKGTEMVLTEGVDGEALRTANVTYANGLETEREVVQDTTLRAPVTEVIALGTGESGEASQQPIIGDGYIQLPTGEILTYNRVDYVRATAYTHTDAGCDMTTATGTTVHWGTVAVDPRNIPYGTRMFIVSNDGSYVYGLATAEDCGGDIKGDRMDLYMPTLSQCMEFGRRRCTVYFLGD